MKQRLRAFIIHFLASALAVGAVAWLVFWIWYPGAISELLDVQGIVLMMLGVDAILGPLMTLLIYKPGKKHLKLDLSFVVLVQVMALGYGIHTVAEVRPAWLVFSGYRFDLVSSNAVDKGSSQLANPVYRGASWTGPLLVAARMPANPQRRQELTLAAINGGVDLSQCPDTYVPIDSAAGQVSANARPLQELAKYNAATALDSLHQRWPDADGWFLLRTKTQLGVVLVNRASGRVLALSALKPA